MLAASPFKLDLAPMGVTSKRSRSPRAGWNAQEISDTTKMVLRRSRRHSAWALTLAPRLRQAGAWRGPYWRAGPGPGGSSSQDPTVAMKRPPELCSAGSGKFSALRAGNRGQPPIALRGHRGTMPRHLRPTNGTG